MVEKSINRQKKCFITEEDISTILQRYTATTVLALLQELAQVQDHKIDWNKMVKKTSTGITNAREYQMLWRHLAYHDSLLDRFDHGAQPIDDDSDLEYEVEAFPAVSGEASAEAAACVKVLIASGSSSDANGTSASTLEAPLTINIPNSQALRTTSENPAFASYMRGKNITVPISVQKQPLPSITNSENLESSGAANNNNRKRRKTWSEQEDQELFEAVRKHGEGNWANILKGSFKSDRSAAQLSQRWTTLRRRLGNINVGSGSQLTEAQLATRRAVAHALDMPVGDNLKLASSVKAGTSSHITSGKAAHSAAAELVGTQPQAKSQQDPAPSAAQRPVATASTRPRVAGKKPTTKMTLSPDSMVKATAVAAGARIATPSDAATLLKAAQSKNAVHIMPGGGSIIKPSVPGNASQLPSNVHFIRTGLATKPLSTYSSIPIASRLSATQQIQGNSMKSAPSAVQSNSENIVLGLGASSQVTNGAAFHLISELEVKTLGEAVNASSVTATRSPSQKDNGGAVNNVLMSEASGIPEDIAVVSGASSQGTNGAVSNLVSELELKPLGEAVNASSENATRSPGQKDNGGAVGKLISEIRGNLEDTVIVSEASTHVTIGPASNSTTELQIKTVGEVVNVGADNVTGSSGQKDNGGAVSNVLMSEVSGNPEEIIVVSKSSPQVANGAASNSNSDLDIKTVGEAVNVDNATISPGRKDNGQAVCDMPKPEVGSNQAAVH